MPNSEILVLGKIQGIRGVRGALKVFRRGNMLDALKKKSSIELFSAKGLKDGFLLEPVFFSAETIEDYTILNHETAQLKLTGWNTAEEAGKLKGLFIGIGLAEAKKQFQNPDDPYLFEYIGLDIYVGDVLMGKVIRVEEYNGKQWLVGYCLESEVMIPMQGPFIEKTDFENSRIYIMPESGLFPANE